MSTLPIWVTGLLRVWLCMPQPHRGNGPFLEFQIFRSWVIIRLLHLQVKLPAVSHIAAHTLLHHSGVWLSAALPLHCQEGNIADPPLQGAAHFPCRWTFSGGQSYQTAPSTRWASEIRDNNGHAQLSLSQESWCWAQKGEFPTAPQPQVGQPPPPPQPAPSGADFPSPSWLLIYFQIKCEDTDFLPCPGDLLFPFLQEI